MKHIIALATLILSVVSLFSQDRDPSPYKFTYQYDGKLYTDTCLSQEVFKQKHFVLGAQWGMYPTMARALHMNVNQGWPPTLGYGHDGGLPPNPYTDYPMYHIWQNVEFWTDPNLPETQNKYHRMGMCFVFEPTLYIPPNQRGQFITKPNDTTRAIWGFSDIRATIPSSTADPDFDRLKITTSVPIGTVVLNNAWPKDLYYFNDSGTEEDKTKRNGRQWILSVNLRYLDSNINNSGTSPAISIKMPYRLRTSDSTWDPTEYIKFSSLPSGNPLDLMRYGYFEDLGKGYNWVEAPSRPTVFNIPYNLIPDKNRRQANGINRDITVNAVFICDGPGINNPLLKSAPTQSDRIDTLDIEVTYHGGADIGINWIRVCTPYTYEHYTGKYDSAAYYWAKRCIDTIRYYGYNNYYVYTLDEHGPQYYSGLGRYSKQYNGCIVAEGSGGLHHKYGENAAHVWGGCSNFDVRSYAPYVFNHPPYWHEFKDPIYRLGHRDENRTYSAAVDYNNIETDFDGDDFWISWRDTTKWTETKFSSTDAYLGRINDEQCFQERIENSNVQNYYFSQDVTYKDTLWWANNLPMGQWGGFWHIYKSTYTEDPLTGKRIYIYDSIPYPQIGWNRPNTGEEVRWHIWNRLIFGAKGLMYDAHCQAFVDSLSNTLSLGFLDVRPEFTGYFDTASVETLLYKDDPIFGVDFIPPVDSATRITNFLNRDSTGKYLGTGPDRIYYGRKSPKIEMYKAHTFIRAVDSLLMNMRLVATFSKGIRTWENSDVAHGYSNRVLDSIIKVDRRWIIYDPNYPNDPHITLPSDTGIKTRPLGRMKNKTEHFEPYDSSFVDITLHRLSNDPTLKNNFVLGVQNRRVDPLVYFPNEPNMSFWSTAELEDSCKKSSNPRLWKERYWQRLGVREVRIPFNYKKNVLSNNNTLLSISELGIDNANLQAQWWRHPDYCHSIDTIISRDGELVLRMLPGEGKFLKVEVCNATYDFTGNLDRSNQKKVVGYPLNSNEDLSQTGTGEYVIKYHAAYYKNNVGTPPKSRAFYMGSLPTARRFPNETIFWTGHETR
ncbi:MAG: hypothetical protein ACM3U1_10010 [Chloroflexota bacterium]